VDHGEAWRIVALTQRDQADVEGGGGRELTLGLAARMDARRAAGAAAARQVGQGSERRARTAVMLEQGAERARADMVAANEAQPVEPLLVGDAHAAAGG